MEIKHKEVKSFGEIVPKKSNSTRSLYEHQKSAMICLDKIDKQSSYSTLLVLPTGGGKTYTASSWLLTNAIDKGKKILWIAHRQILLEQAAESFQKYAYSSVIPHTSLFRYRIVSGASSHDKTIHIQPTDNLLILSKDSIGRNIERLDLWLDNEKEIYLVIDEAHHSTAKTYRKIIDYLKSKVESVKLIGLTATPFRTAEKEQGLLSKIYTDGVKDGKVVKNESGIVYQIGLKELISRGILSTPNFESCFTDETYGLNLGIDDIEHIQHLDSIPDKIAEQMINSAGRNKIIVDTYKNNSKKYGQTIVFAVNISHAVSLSELFNKAGIKADYIVSDIKDMATGVIVSREENERKLEEYRKGNIEVLVNVNILTEGVDLPQTKTVFLARPTVSTILMTQMIGRALRGKAAGGTSEAYIVSFIDNWNEHIAWVNPQSLFIDENQEFTDNETDRTKRFVSMIALSKIEEFASVLDDKIDTAKLENLPFEKRIPIGMYVFNYIDEKNMDRTYQVIVYNSTKDAYSMLMNELPALFDSFGIDEEYPPEEIIDKMEKQCSDIIFTGEMIPSYDSEDIKNILRYFALYDEAPAFYPLDDIERSKLDVSAIAQAIWDEDMGGRRRKEYLDKVWENNDDNLLKLFFGRKLYFLRQIDIEFEKISHPELFKEEQNVKFGKRDITELSLSEIKKEDAEYEKGLRDGAFEKALTDNGNYKCAICSAEHSGRVYFQVDHIIPMNKGGKSVPDNLQILCRKCNGEKSDN